MNGTPLQVTLREMQVLWANLRFWAGLGAVSIILAIAGPFGTHEAIGLFERLVYWTLIAGLTFFCGLFFSFFVGLNLGKVGMPEWPARVAGSVISGLPVALVVWLTNRFVFGLNMGGTGAFLSLWAYCTVISIAVFVLFFLARKPETDGVQHTRFLKRLPRHLGRNLLHVSSQDHYVDAVTDKGSHLILMRFSDALDELADADGIQIHRMHWVSLQAVKRPVRKDGKLVVEMSDGKRLPVSRSHLKAVREHLNI